jgi:predicted RNA-binding Zn-ribbon protein involved in translation (DUF1610 family)
MGMVYEATFWMFEPTDAENDIGNIHVIADNFWDSLEEITIYLDDKIGENKYELLCIHSKPEINIVNYLNDDEEDDDGDDVKFLPQICDHCKKTNIIPGGMKQFKCNNCGKETMLPEANNDELNNNPKGEIL